LRHATRERDARNPCWCFSSDRTSAISIRPAAQEFMRAIRGALQPGDALLLGAGPGEAGSGLQLAYDDPLGVTAAFNRNLLVRINRELGADFDLDAFAHVAVWNPASQRVEMHLESRPTRRRIDGAAPSVRDGERIWTESSYKYEPRQIERWEACRLRDGEQWIDGDARFALTLMTAF
jgi:uncharacterized SAM-dependent methyltransferase